MSRIAKVLNASMITTVRSTMLRPAGPAVAGKPGRALTTTARAQQDTGGSASMQSSSRGNQGSGAGQQQQQQQQGSQRFQGANPQTAVQRTGGRPRAMMQRRPRGGRAGESLLTPFFASDVPGFGRVGGLLRGIEDEMNDMIIRFGLLDPTLDVLDVATDLATLPDAGFNVDVRESEKDITVHADLPGVKKDDVFVEVSPDKVLTIRAERKDERDEASGQTRRTERQYGVFVRRFQLPDNVDPEHVEAKLENGELTVKVPKVEQPEKAGRVIAVQ